MSERRAAGAGKARWLTAVIASLFAGASLATVMVAQPDGDVVAEGQDFATYELGDRWDMSNTADVVLAESQNMASESIQNGLYTAVSATNDPRFFLLFQGITSSVLTLDRGQLHPIDTSTYRYFTIRLRINGSFPSGTNVLQVFFYDDENAIRDSRFGFSEFISVTPGEWTTLTIDLAAQSHPASSFAWTDFPLVRGLAVDPVAAPNASIEIDWVRLTAEPKANQQFLVEWSDAGAGPYTISATGLTGTTTLAENATPPSELVDLSVLMPGQYDIAVSRSGSSDSGAIRVNEAPIIRIVQPDRRGDEGNRYSVAVNANSWECIDAGDIDFSGSLNLVNPVFNDPTCALRASSSPGDGVTGDPAVLMATQNEALDTERYRLACFELAIDGERDVGLGSVARLLYGNALTALVPTEDIIIQAGRNEYCLGDLRDIPLEGDAPSQWFGSLDFLRVDPHEFSVPRVFRLFEVLLAPFDTADPSFGFQWQDQDADSSAGITLFADEDRTPGNGNETMIVSGLEENDSADVAEVVVAGLVPAGEYWIYGEISDGLNTTRGYSGERLQVGEGNQVVVNVDQPDGLNDEVVAGRDYARDELRNAWDMSQSSDFEATANVGNESFSGGIYGARSNNTDPQLWLLDPRTATNTIDATEYRYATVKVRFSDGDACIPGAQNPNNLSFLFFTSPQNLGFTNGRCVSPGAWEIVTFDLLSDVPGASALQWGEVTPITGFRLDPTTRANVGFEIDWVRLSAPDDGTSSFTVRWSEKNLTGSSSFEVTLVDQGGAELLLADGLPFATRNLPVDMSFYEPGEYDFRITAVPGPSGESSGPLRVVEAPDPDLVFANGFEP